MAMSVPIDRPLKLHESFFLNDAAITLAARRAPGKPARVLVGGAVHFATKRWRTTSRSRRR